MKVGLRLSIALFTFFPLVFEFAQEIAFGTFMDQSQVRIMGANAASEEPDKTDVLIDLLPLGDVFENSTVFLVYERFWHKQVFINSSYFGDYEVLYVRYPGVILAWFDPHAQERLRGLDIRIRAGRQVPGGAFMLVQGPSIRMFPSPTLASCTKALVSLLGGLLYYLLRDESVRGCLMRASVGVEPYIAVLLGWGGPATCLLMLTSAPLVSPCSLSGRSGQCPFSRPWYELSRTYRFGLVGATL
ncbi:hypothetical protein BHM03_00048193 [Ensete ventricosum]|nr:hypothetical protein BHM03_00048193 [Ensete ventricosum]